MEHQQPAGRALGSRMMGDQFGGQVEVEIGKVHRSMARRHRAERKGWQGYSKRGKVSTSEQKHGNTTFFSKTRPAAAQLDRPFD
jgi:hypothetical protein